ncbi:MAG: glycosyltransferase family 39 protein [Luteolibacter sp.]|uniref:glycosyltransferase family 39 protein n=1 Tax=Luteolibacter sp. TaxID=1962973 RepID=UPI0032644FB3
MPSLPISSPPLSSSGPPESSWLRDLTVITILGGLWFCALLGMRPLSNPDEGRYTEIPREMAVTGDFVTPRLDGVKYFEKPPLVYWLSALTFREFGVNEFTARLWGGIFSLFGVLMTYAAARALYGRGAGIWSAVVLSTTIYYYGLSQIMLLDMAVAVTMSGALFAFIVAMREPRGKRRFALFMVFYVMMALATLSKGLIGIALPGAVIFLWVLLLNRWRTLWPFYPVVGTVVLLAIAAPWHVLAAKANPDFLNFYFYHEHWLRFTTTIHGRYEPWWFFIPIFIGGLFPWVFFAGRTLKSSLPGGWKLRKEHADAWFFVIWTVFIILFFSKSQSKLVPYILPVFPACAVLLGRYLSSVWEGKFDGKCRPATMAFAVAALLMGIAAFVVPTPKNQPELAAYLPVLRVTGGLTLLCGAAAAFLGLRRNNPRLMIGSVATSSAIFLLALSFGAGSFDKASTKRFAMILKPILKPEDRVYCVGFYGQDLPPYLGRLVSVVESEGELSYGINAEPKITSSRFLDRDAFADQWKQSGDAYALIRESSFERWFGDLKLSYEIMDKSDRFVLIKRTDPK